MVYVAVWLASLIVRTAAPSDDGVPAAGWWWGERPEVVKQPERS
jgi:hypothetical protein